MARAVVLGGGGLTGVAWLTGLIKALDAARVPLGAADTVIGTSAGSVVGTQLTAGRDFAGLYRWLSAPRVPTRQGLQRLYGLAPKPDPAMFAELVEQWATAPPTSPETRAATGAEALAARSMPERAWVGLVASYVRQRHWPGPALAVCVVDTHDGAFRVLRQGDGVPVARAVAASSAVPRFFPPVTIAGRRYMDGGVRSITNADVAAGHEVVVLVADHRPLEVGEGGLSRAALDAEIAGLRAGGSTVVAVEPDDASVAAMGMDALGFERLGPAALAGRAQGEREADRLAEVWG